MPRHLNFALYSAGAVLLLAGIIWQQQTTARIDGKREGSALTERILNECSSTEMTKQSPDCKSRYPAYPTAWDQAAQNAQLLKSMGKEIAAQTAKQQEARKAVLIEVAIRSLAKEGVTEDDLKDYFREAIRDEERETIIDEECALQSEE